MLSDALGWAGPALAGIAMGLQFNVVYATVAAVIAAAVAGYPGAPAARLWLAAGVLAVGWAFGDGIALAGAVGPGASATVYGGAWALVGICVGYLVPAAVGAAVGRSVYRGTGWLAAGVVALTIAPALSVISQRVAPAIFAAGG